MSSNILQKKINEYLLDNGMSVSEFERNAGLKQSAVRNILYGKSKSPTIDTIQVIANELGITVDCLLNNKNQEDKVSSPVNLRLLKEVSSKAISTLYMKGADINLKEAMSLIEESYSYSLRKGSADSDFIEWMVESKYKEQ